MEVQKYTLNNGIRLLHFPVQSLVAHLGVFLNTGSRDEMPEENGLAHFIEHVIFKGTKKRKAFQVLSRLENVGGDLNAFTTKEETCIYASFLPEHYGRTLELFSDILFDSTFPEKELKKEKEVILDEINSYLDTPFEQIFDDFEEQLFNGHSLGRNILGTPEHIHSFGKKEVNAFIRRNYRTEETVICSVGPVKPGILLKQVERHFAERSWEKGPRERIAVNGYTPTERMVRRNGFQAHCVMGNRAYALEDPRTVPMSLLNNILGGPGMNSRLNLSVREKHALTYHIESGYHPFSDSGVFELYLGTDRTDLEKALKLVHKELKKLREQTLGTLQLQRARQQLKGQIAIAGESNLNLMLAMGKSMLTLNKLESLKDMYRKIDAVEAPDILEVANDILNPAAFSTLIYDNPPE